MVSYLVLEADERVIEKFSLDVGSKRNKAKAMNGVDGLFDHFIACVPEKVAAQVV